MKFVTTLRKLRKAGACENGYKQLRGALGKRWKYDTPIPLTRILESNGIDDAMWALRTVPDIDRELRHFTCDCAERALPAFAKSHDEKKAERLRNTIDAYRRFANGEIAFVTLTRDFGSEDAYTVMMNTVHIAMHYAVNEPDADDYFYERFRFWFSDKEEQE